MISPMELDATSVNQSKKLISNTSNQPMLFQALDEKFPTNERYLFGFERQPGLKEADTPGFYPGSHRHILTYDPSEVRSLLVPLTDKDLTVCNSVGIWLYHLGFVVYALLLMFFLAYTSFGDGAMGAGSACSDDNTHQNLNICSLEDVLTDAKSDFRWLIAFILAGYVGISVSQWAVRRQNYASLCGSARNTNILLASFLPIDEENANSNIMVTRRTLGRWIMLAYELAVLKARGHMDTDEGKEHLIALRLLDEKSPDAEWNAMVVGDRHSTVFWWIQSKLVELERAHLLPPHHLQVACTAISKMRGAANDLMSSLDRDKPFPYTAICGVLVYINILIMSTWKGVTWSIWYFTNGPDLFNQPRIWVDMFVLLFWNISYAALYDLGYMLHNPFGKRRIDVAHEMIGAGIRKLSSSLASAVGHMPPFLQKKMTYGKIEKV